MIVRLLCCALPFSVLNVTMFNVAVPDLARVFGVSPASMGWTVTGFAVFYSIGSLMYGKLADRYEVRKLFVFGAAVFGCGSLLGIAADSFPMLLAARMVQAVGASCFPTMATLIPARFVPEERRGKALGTVAATLSVSGGVGPLVGGWIVEWLHWKALFLVSLGVWGVVPFLAKWLPGEREEGGLKANAGRPDAIGAGLIGAGAACLMLAVTRADWRLLAGAAVLLGLFLLRQKAAANPFIPRGLFGRRSYRFGLTMGVLASAANIGVTLLSPLALSRVYGFDAGMIGLLMFPGAFCAALMGRHGGKLADRKGTRLAITLAMGLLGTGLLSLFGTVGLGGQSGLWPWAVAACLIAANTGSNFMQSALAKRVSAALPSGSTGVGMGVFGLTNFLSVGVAGSVVTKLAETAEATAAPALAFGLMLRCRCSFSGCCTAKNGRGANGSLGPFADKCHRAVPGGRLLTATDRGPEGTPGLS